MSNSWISDIKSVFESHAHTENAAQMQAYLRNKFVFYGIKSPLRKEISKPFLRKEGLPTLEEALVIAPQLWALPQREYHYLAMELLNKYAKKQAEDVIQLYESLITHQTWWDTVDFIASNLIGTHFKLYPHLIDEVSSQKWMQSDNFWLRRTSLLFQLKYKQAVDFDLLTTYILHCIDEREFFIRKAIGWALREYSKVDAERVKTFVAHQPLSLLSKTEALKWLQKQEKK